MNPFFASIPSAGPAFPFDSFCLFLGYRIFYRCKYGFKLCCFCCDWHVCFCGTCVNPVYRSWTTHALSACPKCGRLQDIINGSVDVLSKHVCKNTAQTLKIIFISISGYLHANSSNKSHNICKNKKAQRTERSYTHEVQKTKDTYSCIGGFPFLFF